ncbi:hypothetical protein K2X05_06930 [bacterium]|nr:hypothetical protein [bacterium]
MKYILCLFAVFVSTIASAKYTGNSRTPQTLTDGNWSGQNSIYGQITPYADGVGFAFSYEKSIGEQLGVGGTFTYLPEDDSAPVTAVGLMSFGANVRLHYPVQYFDFYVTPGINLMMMELGPEDDTTIGASLAFGTLAQVNKSFAVGMELSAIQPWFSDDFFLASRSYFFNSSLTARFSF